MSRGRRRNRLSGAHNKGTGNRVKAMRVLKTVSVGLASIGWLAPFLAVLYLFLEYSMHSRLLAFLGERRLGIQPEIRFYANALCVLGVLWLATAVTGWTVYLTRRKT